MNKRDTVLSLVDSQTPPAYVPAAFFMHFDPAYHQGQAAIDKHLEFFRATGMDFVKIQYEQSVPPAAPVRPPEDWEHASRCDGRSLPHRSAWPKGWSRRRRMKRW